MLAPSFHAHSIHPLGRLLFFSFRFLFTLPLPMPHFLFHIYVSQNAVAAFFQIWYERERDCCEYLAVYEFSKVLGFIFPQAAQADDVRSYSNQKCLILGSKILLNVLHNTSLLTVLLPWQQTGFRTSPILKAFLATFGVPFWFLLTAPHMHDPASI